jgi:hypothetical protein
MAFRSLLALPLLVALLPLPAAAATWSCTLGTTIFGPNQPVAFKVAAHASPGTRLYPLYGFGAPRTRYTVVINDADTFMATGDYWHSGPDDRLLVLSEALSIDKDTGHLRDVVTSYGPHHTHRVEAMTGRCVLLP